MPRKYKLKIDRKALIEEIRESFKPQRGESHAANSIGFLCEEIDRLRAILKEADDYLNTNKLTNIAHGSILHKKFKDA